MKAEELRIGNLIFVNNIEKSTTLTMLYEGGLNEYCKHIPLSEKWLLKFGFEKVEDDDLERSKITPQYFFEHFHLIGGVSTDKEIWIISKMTEDNFMPLSDIKYVHQLQNLYFAITGTELTYETES